MIVEDYVSFEIAKLLKEKGFDGKCFAAYNGNGKLYEFNKEVDDNTPYWSDAPTLQMVLKYLREKHEVFISIGCCTYPKLKKVTYIPEITTFDSVFGDVSIEYDSYEEACETAIKYCLENLI